MIEQIDFPLWFKFNGFLRYFLAHGCLPHIKYYIVNEYPKSGGSWIASMLSDALAVPFPRNRLPMFRSSILHGHMMQCWNMRKVLVVWRDGRDVLVSQYYHSLFENDRGNALLVRRTRSDIGFANYHDIQTNLLRFMEYVYENPAHPRFTWKDFANKWIDCESCVHLRYEAIRANPEAELFRVVEELSGVKLSSSTVANVIGDHSFEKLTGRTPGKQDANSFLRKGIVGDWKNHFTPEARRMFDHYAGDALVDLGYESNRQWVDSPAG